MLSPHEISVGSLTDAQPLTLLLPRTKYENTILIAGFGNERVAIFLGKDHQFDSFPFDTNDHWKGLLIPGISIELDETRAFDPETDYVPKGSVVRIAGRLEMAVESRDSNRFTRQIRVPLVAGLPPARESYRAGFRKWQIVLGEGQDKRVLHKVSVEPAQSPQ